MDVYELKYKIERIKNHIKDAGLELKYNDFNYIELALKMSIVDELKDLNRTFENMADKIELINRNLGNMR